MIKVLRKPYDLPPENNNGWVEYKWKLTGVSNLKKVKIATQMNFRLREGNGRCSYALGFHDNGIALGMNYKDFKETINNLTNAVEELDAIIYKNIYFEDNNLYWAKVFIKKHIDECAIQ